MANAQLYAFFTASKAGKTGLSPTIDIYKVTKTTGGIVSFITAGDMTTIGGGFYVYTLTGADTVLYEYPFVVKTTDATVDQKEIPGVYRGSMSIVAGVDSSETTINGIKAKTDLLAFGYGGVTANIGGINGDDYAAQMLGAAFSDGTLASLILSNLDAPVSSRLASADYNASVGVFLPLISNASSQADYIVEWFNGASGTLYDDVQTIKDHTNILRILSANKTIADPITHTQKVYSDDGNTVFVSALIYEDPEAQIPYRGQGISRREKFQ